MKLQFASALAEDVEPYFVFWGQSNSRPWGVKVDGFAQMPMLDRRNRAGYNVTATLVLGTGGLTAAITIAEVVTDLTDFVGAQFRFRPWSVTPTATSATGPQLTVSGTPFLANQLKNQWVTLNGSTGLVASNGTNTVTFRNATVTIALGTPGIVTWTGHALATGTPVVFTGGGGAAELVRGTTYYVVVIDANTFKLSTTLAGALASTGLVNVVANSTGTVTGCMTWNGGTPATTGTAVISQSGYGTIAAVLNANTVLVKWFGSGNDGYPSPDIFPSGPLSGPIPCYITRDDGRFKFYENVRILTPFQPELLNTDISGATLPYPPGPVRVPGYSFPPEIASYEDAGLFLPLTFLEGVEGAGAIGTGTATDTSFQIGDGNTYCLGKNTLVGGLLVAGKSRASIASNTEKGLCTLDANGWVGGTPVGTAIDFQAWQGHFNDNPHAYLGDGFRYPNNDMQPCANAVASQGTLHNNPRGFSHLGGNGVAGGIQGNFSYGDRFGALVAFAARVAQQIGRRVNIIYLGVNSSGQLLRNIVNRFGFKGQIGWWDYRKHLDWTPSDPDSDAARLQKLIRTIGPAALTAEGSTKKLKCLGIVGFDMEADALDPDGRAMADETIAAFYAWLRGVIDQAGHNPYGQAAKVPVAHAHISHVPYEFVGTVVDYPGLVFTGDGLGLVNRAITDFCAKDGFARVIATSDLQDSKLGYGGTSGANGQDPLHFNGKQEAINGQNAADAMGELVNLAMSQSLGKDAVTLCNLALSQIGLTARIKSLDITVDTSEEAARCADFFGIAADTLLETKQWGFATKRITPPALSSSPSDAWPFAYGLPGDCLKAVNVFLPGAVDDSAPQDFKVEDDQDGSQILLAKTSGAVLRYIARSRDVRVWPANFRMADAWYLGSLLAGALIRGDEGAKVSQRCITMANGFLAAGAGADAQQGIIRPFDGTPQSVQARGGFVRTPPPTTTGSGGLPRQLT